ncbi:hypothetical protein FBU59_001429 [Linderina macrospora]|uniref:Uncharacterized protein n=1 Tax=Linderina macrospora TaxID=4868 RepID=A0ACC1JE94_9FUNG|nr:hypothetical protein FBU59_001429 [Linderina macrospora]
MTAPIAIPSSSSVRSMQSSTIIVRYSMPQSVPAPQNYNSHIITPSVRSAGIGGYKNVYTKSQIGGPIHERRDSGMGKLCMPFRSPKSERRFSLKRVMSFSKLRRASAPESN